MKIKINFCEAIMIAMCGIFTGGILTLLGAEFFPSFVSSLIVMMFASTTYFRFRMFIKHNYKCA